MLTQFYGLKTASSSNTVELNDNKPGLMLEMLYVVPFYDAVSLTVFGLSLNRLQNCIIFHVTLDFVFDTERRPDISEQL